MGLDPITLAMAGSVATSAYGAYKSGKDANKRYDTGQRQGNALMQPTSGGQDPYQQALFGLLKKQGDPMQVGVNDGAIDTASVMGNFNTGQDALMQFLRADPSKQQAFTASDAFNELKQQDQRTEQNAITTLNSNFTTLGSRFGTGAARQTSDLLANLGAQTGVRNAGILQTSFENQQNRALQGMGLNLSASQSLGQQNNTMAQLAAQLAIGNQNNQQFNNTFNQGSRQQAFQNQMAGIQGGFGMQDRNNQTNNQLFSIMQGMTPPTGNAYTAAGSAGMDMSQMLMMLNMLKPKAA